MIMVRISSQSKLQILSNIIHEVKVMFDTLAWNTEEAIMHCKKYDVFR